MFPAKLTGPKLSPFPLFRRAPILRVEHNTKRIVRRRRLADYFIARKPAITRLALSHLRSFTVGRPAKTETGGWDATSEWVNLSA